jgi:alpha-tubulin suppressor-like RCC1 family protein
LGVNKTNTQYSTNLVQINTNIAEISCGCFHNIVLNKLGKVYGFGDNSFGQLGILYINETFTQSLINLNNIIQITTGNYNTLLLNNINQIFSFGSNQYGQLGLNLPFNSNIYIPIQIVILNIKIIQISCGNYHCLILIDTGEVYSFGFNNVNL